MPEPVGVNATLIMHDAAEGRWRLFRKPTRVLCAQTTADVQPLMAAVDRALDEGMWAAGFLSYEAAAGFDAAMRTHAPDSFPILWFGLFEQCHNVDLPEVDGSDAPPRLEWTPSVTRGEYDRAIETVKAAIARGQTYQVNYTYRLQAGIGFDPVALFVHTMVAQSPPFGAYLDLGRWAICSASPELFVRLDGRDLWSKPMKGTAPRGLWVEDDRRCAEALRNSEKDRAENLMIVDMVRNDMGRIAETGSVSVPELFSVERYTDVWQMTSTVHCRTDASVGEILATLFPAASITGAPKVRTTQIIADLETTPRHIYTGTIGFAAPHRAAQFSVAIRTVLVDRADGRSEYGTGGGIVWDSAAPSEFEESQAKAAVLTGFHPEVQLIETLLWTPEEGYFLLEPHLERLLLSADYFGWAIDPSAVRRTLDQAPDAFLLAVPHRVRLTVARSGTIDGQAEPIRKDSAADAALNVALAPEPIDRNNRFLYHKTTQRDVYESMRRARPDHDDVILWNDAGELTEFTIGNLVVKTPDGCFTPPVASGLLPGVFRRHLLATGEIRERVLTRTDLERAGTIFRINSVRTWQPARLDAADT